jgi:hypothetical protein
MIAEAGTVVLGADLRAVTRGFSEDGFLVFPMHSNIAVARVK